MGQFLIETFELHQIYGSCLISELITIAKWSLPYSEMVCITGSSKCSKQFKIGNWIFCERDWGCGSRFNVFGASAVEMGSLKVSRDTLLNKIFGQLKTTRFPLSVVE